MFRLAALASLLAVSTGYNVQQYPPQNPFPARSHSAPLGSGGALTTLTSGGTIGGVRATATVAIATAVKVIEIAAPGYKHHAGRYFKRNGRSHAAIECPTDGSIMSITTSDGTILSVGAGAEKIARCRNGRWQAQSIDGQFVRFISVQCLKDVTVATPTGSAPTKPFPSRPTPTRPHPTRTAPTRPHPTNTPPAGPDHTRTHPTRPHPSHTASTQPESTGTQPTRPKPTNVAPTKPEPTHAAPTEPASTHSPTVRPSPTHIAPTHPTHASPTRPAPTGGH
ncbi:hypothetical protein COOONC_06863 [Cooperia oncophora]